MFVLVFHCLVQLFVCYLWLVAYAPAFVWIPQSINSTTLTVTHEVSGLEEVLQYRREEKIKLSCSLHNLLPSLVLNYIWGILLSHMSAVHDYIHVFLYERFLSTCISSCSNAYYLLQRQYVHTHMHSYTLIFFLNLFCQFGIA